MLDFADSAADNAKIGQQIAKLFVEKKKEESALEDAYKELGKLYYDMHKTEAEGVLADLCMEIENTLINIEDITAEIEALKSANDVDLDDLEEIHITMDEAEEPDECEHEWTEATCEALATCSKCGETTGNYADHAYGAWIDEVPATAEANGTKGH